MVASSGEAIYQRKQVETVDRDYLEKLDMRRASSLNEKNIKSAGGQGYLRTDSL